MLSPIKPLTKVLLLFLLAMTFIQSASAQQGNLIIKGNIKITKQQTWELDECCFHYKDILTNKDVVIPIRRDTAGNFLVNMQLDGYQQIYFSKAADYKGQLMYNTGSIYFSFFGKPGQTMQLNYEQITRPYKLTFAGDFAVENNEYQKYVKAEDVGVKNLYGDVVNKKFTPAQVKEKALTSFKDKLSFNAQYFKTHPAPAFVKEQAYYRALYQTQDAAIQLNFLSRNAVTEDMVSDFYRAMNSTGKTFKDGPGINLKGILDPNPSLKNPGALGNREYKSFISSYFSVLDNNMKYDSVEIVLNKDLAAYVINKYHDLKEDDKKVLTDYLDPKTKHNDAEQIAMHQLASLYANEFLQIRHNRQELGKYLAIKDPAIRDLGVTMELYKKLNFNQIDYIEPLLGDYNKSVKNTYLKNKFMTAYKAEMDKLHHSKMSPLAILNSSEQLKGPDVLTQLLEKYKDKVVYVDIWATWCGPCIAGMEASQKLRGKLKGEGVVFLYLCIDSPNEEGWKNVIAAKNMEGENYFLDKNQSSAVSRALNIQGIPYYFTVDKNGDIVNKNSPHPGEPETFKQLKDLLEN